MKQGVLPFQYQQENGSPGMTALSGLMTYLELLHVSGLKSSVERCVGLRRGGQGWTDSQIVSSLILLNLAGGESVSDLDVLDKDEGFGRMPSRDGDPRDGSQRAQSVGTQMACGASAERAVGVRGVPVLGGIQ